MIKFARSKSRPALRVCMGRPWAARGLGGGGGAWKHGQLSIKVGNNGTTGKKS